MTDDDDRLWTPVCPYQRLEPERGVAALVRGVQIALFRLYDGRVYAVGNRDPISGAYVLSRGIVGTRGDTPVVASPLYKQAYDLRTGECLDVAGVRVPTYPVSLRDQTVRVRLVAAPPRETVDGYAELAVPRP